MEFDNCSATLFIPDGAEESAALSRTTRLCVAAHQDDIEFMAYNGIADCFAKQEEWFAGVVVTDGAGSPRCGRYADHTDEQMKRVRIYEQNAAAMVGGYSFVAQLGYTSAQVKDAEFDGVVNELARLLLKIRPEIIYTHNLADRHPTHLSVCLRVIAALKLVAAEYQPKKLYGMEVWRSLDWLCEGDKQLFDASAHPNIASSVSACFDSQISGGKRYDLAIAGRRAANATFGASHAVDFKPAVMYGMDMTPALCGDITPQEFIAQKTAAFAAEVSGLIESHSRGSGR